MIDFLNYIWLHFSGIRWGWWASSDIVIPENIECVSISFLIAIGIFLVANLIHFIVVGVDSYRGKTLYFYIPAVLSYMILNVDLNIKTISGVGMIVQNDGIIRCNQMVLKYYERTKQYMLSVNLHDKIEVDRVLIVFDFKLNLDNISTITNIVKPIPIELPEDGSMSRPGN